MKIFRKLCYVLLLAAVLVIPSVIGLLPSTGAKAADGISLTKVVLKPGKTKKISVEGYGTGFTWTSSNSSVAKITRKVKADNNATITAKAEGVAVITVTNGKKTFQCNVVVMEEEKQDSAPAGTSATKSDTYRDITVFEKSGTASILRSKKTLSVVKDMKLKNEDYATVGKNSYLRLCFDDDCYAYFESGTEFAVSKGWFGKIKVCMTKGEMILEVQKKLDDDNSFNIITPNSSMSIRGTVVAVKTIPGKKGKTTTINYVLEGKAVVTLKDKTKITLKAGEGWETTTNKKGKVVTSQKADASKLDFENIDISKLKGADGADMVITLPDNGKDKDDNNTGTDKDNNTDPGKDTGDDGQGKDDPVSLSEYVKAVPAVFDYDKSSFVVAERKEESPKDAMIITKEYDAYGILRHKSEVVSTFIDNYDSESSGKTSNIYEGEEYTVKDSYYDSNRVLRIYRYERTFYPFASAIANNETTNITETYYNAQGKVIYEDVIDQSYDTTKWYDDDGRLAEYMQIRLSDNKEVEHKYYAYDGYGNQKEID